MWGEIYSYCSGIDQSDGLLRGLKPARFPVISLFHRELAEERFSGDCEHSHKKAPSRGLFFMAGVLELKSRAVRPLRPVDEVARSAAKSEPARIKMRLKCIFTILVPQPTSLGFAAF